MRTDRPDPVVDIMNEVAASLRLPIGSQREARTIEAEALARLNEGDRVAIADQLESLARTRMLGAGLDEGAIAALKENLASENGRRALVASIAWAVEQEVLEREQRLSGRSNFLIAAFGVAGAALLAAIGFYGNDLIDRRITGVRDELALSLKGEVERDLVPAAAKLEVSKQLDTEFAERIRLESDFQALTMLATALDVKTSFTNESRDTAMRLFRSFEKRDDFRGRTSFRAALEQTIDSFVDASQLDQVDELVGMYEHECLQSDGISESLMRHYARQLTGSAVSPARVAPQVWNRWEKLSARAQNGQRDARVRAVALAYELLIEFRRHQHGMTSTQSFDELWRVAGDACAEPYVGRADGNPRIDFCFTLLRCTDLNFMEGDTVECREQCRVAAGLLQEQGAAFTAIASALEQHQRAQLLGDLRQVLRRRGVPASEHPQLLGSVVARLDPADSEGPRTGR